MAAGSVAISIECVRHAASSIRCVDGLAGLRAAFLSDAQRLSQSVRSSQGSKTKKSSANPCKIDCQSWGYIVDLSGHWATVFCCVSEAFRITAILFDTLDVQADAEGLYRAGILGNLGEEIRSTFSITFKLFLLMPVSEFRRVPLPAAEADGAPEAKYAYDKVNFNDRVNEKDSTSRLYLNRDLLPFRRIVIQPVLQARRDETCLARGVAVLLWLFGLTALNHDLQCFQHFLGKAQEFEMEIAVEAKDSNQPGDAAPMRGYGEPQKAHMSPQQPERACGDYVSSVIADRSEAHGSVPDSDASARHWASERAIFEPASRLIAADGSPDRFERETHCMVQSIPDARGWNEAANSKSEDLEHCRRRQQELGKQLVELGLPAHLSCNDANAEAHDVRERVILQAAVERWNNLNDSNNSDEGQQVRPGCDDMDLHFSQVSAHSCLRMFFLYGWLQRARSLSGPGSQDNSEYNLVRIPFSVLPFPKLFERLVLKDFLRESSHSELGSPLRAILLRLEVPEKHWSVTVSDFELGGSGDDSVEFWNLVSAAKEVRPPRKLEMKAKHRGVKR